MSISATLADENSQKSDFCSFEKSKSNSEMTFENFYECRASKSVTMAGRDSQNPAYYSIYYIQRRYLRNSANLSRSASVAGRKFSEVSSILNSYSTSNSDLGFGNVYQRRASMSSMVPSRNSGNSARYSLCCI